MSESITFRGAHVRYFDGRQEEGGAFCRIHMTAEFTGPVMEAMDWTDPGGSVTDAKLDGELHAINFILTPGDKQLKQYEMQFPIRSVEDFKVVTIEKDEVKRRELRFVVRSSNEGVAAQVDNYIRRIGDHQGALKISYTAQSELELEESKPAEKPAKKESSGCAHCDAGIPTEDNDDAIHVNGQTCAKWQAPAAPTAAEKKKARLAEEEKKKAMRAGAGPEAVQ